MFNSASETSGSPFHSLDVGNTPATRRWLYARIVLVASGLAFACCMVFWFWTGETVLPENDLLFPRPKSLQHANQLLVNLPPTEQEGELYASLVLPHLPLMYQHFLKFYGSTAPKVKQTIGTSHPVHELNSEEFERRLAYFGENVKEIIKMNALTAGDGPDRAIFMINPFADWSEEERGTLASVRIAIPPQPPFLSHTSNVTTVHEKGKSIHDKRASCEDKQSKSNCDFWYKKSYCESSSEYASYMRGNCPETCGFCPEECVDEVITSNCEFWHGKGYCSKSSEYYGYMQDNCQKTCQFCGEGNGCSSDDCWTELPAKYLGGYTRKYGGTCFSEVEAMSNCENEASCHGINKQYNECGGSKWTLRSGSVGLSAAGFTAAKLISKLLDRTCMERVNNHCDDNDGTSRNWPATYPDAFEVRQQGDCGSCWGHSTVEMMRQHWTINHLAREDTGLLSVQFLVDCVTPYRTQSSCGNMGVGGCCGGWPWRALQYINAVGGLPTQAAYGDYQNDDRFNYHECRSVTPVMTTSGPKYMRTEEQMKQGILQQGSAGITLYSSPINSYAGGVFPARACGTKGMNHAVQLVGYIDEKNAWMIQNSWGNDWGVSRHPPYNYVSGQSGFALLEYGTEVCRITQYPAVMPKSVSRAGSMKALEEKLHAELSAEADKDLVDSSQ